MRFTSGGNVDVKKWKTCGEKVKLEREGGNRPDRQSEIDNEPRFGAGSEFGRIERKEAREARFRPRKVREQPWSLTIESSDRSLEQSRTSAECRTNDAKKFSGKKDGGVMDNSSYYVFFQAEDGAFEAFPVNEWINFTPVQRFKALTAEQAEEQFEKRDKIMNFFPLMKGIKKEDAEGTNDATFSNQVKKERRSFKVSELDEWGGINDSDLDSSEDEGPKGGKKKRGKKKKRGSEDERSEAGEDSDEGDFDQRELDYMSESSESESEAEDVRVNKELKSVADEEGLRKIAASDEEDSEEEKNDANGKDVDRMDIDGNPIKDKDKKIKKESGLDGEISESSAEDSDDSDIDESKPWNQIQSKSSKSSVKSGGSDQGSAPTSRAQTPVKEVPESVKNVPESVKNVQESIKNVQESSKSVQGVKRKLTDSTPASPAASSSSASNPATPSGQPSGGSSSGQPGSKKSKSSDSEGLSEEAVRRYLTRRPMTVRDLIKKFKKSWSGTKQDLMNSIVNILKKINPDKQTIRGELHLSLKAPK